MHSWNSRQMLEDFPMWLEIQLSKHQKDIDWIVWRYLGFLNYELVQEEEAKSFHQSMQNSACFKLSSLQSNLVSHLYFPVQKSNVKCKNHLALKLLILGHLYTFQYICKGSTPWVQVHYVITSISASHNLLCKTWLLLK